MLRKKTPTKKGPRWLTGLKLKNSSPTKTKQNKETSTHFCTGASLANCTSQRNLCWTTCLNSVSAF